MVDWGGRSTVIKGALKTRHICVREILQLVMPGRWQPPELLEELCRRFGHQRLRLPSFDLEAMFPGFSDAPVSVSLLPRGSWSTPLSDQVILAKLAKATDAKTILEVGSFRGYTARVLAENLAPGGVLHCVDLAVDHGEA